jgi:D-3-phosphoglycerate dehydrogenase
MSRPTIVVLDPIHKDGIARAQQEGEVIQVNGKAGGPEVDAALAKADAILVRSTPIDAALVAKAPNLKVVAKHGAGVDNVHIPTLTQNGIPLANTPGMANATAVSEGAVTLMLAVLKQTLVMDEAVRNDNYKIRFTRYVGDMWERTLGIVGIGNIGTHVARICGKGFNMRVLAYDPYLSKEEIAKRGAEKVDDLHAMLAQCDVVTIHTPLNEETEGIIGAAEFAAMKPSAVLVNTSRGPTVDEAALVEALRTKKIAGAGIDVFEVEPPSPDNPLFTLTGVNLVLSPHNAGLTDESTRQMGIRTAEVAIDVLNGRKPATLLNPDVWENRRGATVTV